MPLNRERACPIDSKLIGVGDIGTSVINHIIHAGLQDVGFISVHTDEQVLSPSGPPASTSMRVPYTNQQAVCIAPEMDSRAMEACGGAVTKALAGADMVFLVADMGDCIGVSVASVIAGIAKNMGILTIGVVTRPFDVENHCPMPQAEKGIAVLLAQIDSLVVIPDERLTHESRQRKTPSNTFEIAGDVLYQVVQTMLSVPQKQNELIGLEFSDVAIIMRNAGMVYVGEGRAAGAQSVDMAAKMAMSNPLLETSLCGAKRVLMSATVPERFMLEVWDGAINIILETIHPDADFTFGVCYNQTPEDEACVTVIACEWESNVEDD